MAEAVAEPALPHGAVILTKQGLLARYSETWNTEPRGAVVRNIEEGTLK
jgi:hypothetical protein